MQLLGRAREIFKKLESKFFAMILKTYLNIATFLALWPVQRTNSNPFNKKKLKRDKRHLKGKKSIIVHINQTC